MKQQQQQKQPFEMELGGEVYRVALDMNAILSIRRETGQDYEVLLEKLDSPYTSKYERVDALRVLVWAMIVTDCGKRKIPHPHITEVGLWFQEDSANVAGQIMKFFGVSENGNGQPTGSLAPFVPTPTSVVRKMITLAEIKPGEHVVDLGAGDGRLLFAAVDAAEGVTTTGYETHPGRYEELCKAITEHPKAKQLAVVPADIRQASLGQVDVVFMYLLSNSNASLKPKLMKEMKPGARVVSHDFAMPDWEPEQVETLRAEGRTHTVYQWRIPDAAAVPAQ